MVVEAVFFVSLRWTFVTLLLLLMMVVVVLVLIVVVVVVMVVVMVMVAVETHVIGDCRNGVHWLWSL